MGEILAPGAGGAAPRRWRRSQRGASQRSGWAEAGRGAGHGFLGTHRISYDLFGIPMDYYEFLTIIRNSLEVS